MNVANSRKVVLLTGARRVGKSTFIKSIKEDNREYVTLDNLTLRELASSDPLMFLMNIKKQLLLMKCSMLQRYYLILRWILMKVWKREIIG